MLEHGWIYNEKKERKGEVVGYCENCCCEIYDNEEFVEIDGALYCEHCNEMMYEVENEY